MPFKGGEAHLAAFHAKEALAEHGAVAGATDEFAEDDFSVGIDTHEIGLVGGVVEGGHGDAVLHAGQTAFGIAHDVRGLQQVHQGQIRQGAAQAVGHENALAEGPLVQPVLADAVAVLHGHLVHAAEHRAGLWLVEDHACRAGRERKLLHEHGVKHLIQTVRDAAQVDQRQVLVVGLLQMPVEGAFFSLPLQAVADGSILKLSIVIRRCPARARRRHLLDAECGIVGEFLRLENACGLGGEEDLLPSHLKPFLDLRPGENVVARVTDHLLDRQSGGCSDLRIEVG